MKMPSAFSGRRVFAVVSALTAIGSHATAQTLDSATAAGLRWRTIGPANFEGRLSDVVGIPGPSKTVFVAAAAGGIWKTTNNGTTWRPVFDDKRVISMGMLAIAPSDTQQVWAGTGEPNSRNSIEPGGGIYKSTDGGMTWQLKGLEKTEAIGRIVVHPTNPNIVYVAALGATWKSNPERGLYKTTDGGNTWQLIKFISDKAGFIDVVMSPRDPNVLFAASWERLRTPYSLKSGGPGSALWKTTDGGATWTQVKGGGFPDGVAGRIGLDISRSNPNYIYMMYEGTAANADGSFPTATPAKPPRDNGLWRSTDGGATWNKMNSTNVRPFYYSQVRVDPKNPERVYYSSTQLQVSDDGGRTAKPAAQDVHVDDHGIWIDPNDPERWFLANDGGVAITFDKGGNFVQGQNIPIAQFYEVSYDMAVPYNICTGAQDNGTWCGPSRRRAGTTPLSYWFTIAGGDGFYAAQDPTNPNIVYGESQGGNASRLNLQTGERQSFVKPSWQQSYRQWEDSIATLRGDPLKPATREVTAAITALRAKQRQDSIDLSLRFNWNSPFFISPHNPAVIYFAGNRLLKSNKRGEDFTLISPDLSKKLAAKIDTSLRLTGGITLDATGAETYGTIVAIDESPMKAGLIIAGTDDGAVWKTSNDGATWENLTPKLASFLPNGGEVYVSRVEASAHDTNTFYVTMDNHRWGDFKPYVFTTTDGGKSFRSISNNLPNDGPGDHLHVIREDNRNRDLLFVGSSIAVYASLDRGKTWTKFMSGMPSVPIYDLQIHPRDRELIAATHGRGIWIVDIAPLQQATTTVLANNVNLFEPKPAFHWGEAPTRAASGNGNGQMFWTSINPTYGASISYRVTGAGGAPARISIVDALGDTITSLTGPGTPGLHTVTWPYNGTRATPTTAAVPLSPSERRDSVLRAVRAPQVLDSLQRVRFDSAAIAMARTALNPPAAPAGFGGRGGGGGGGGRGGAGCERPMTQWDTFCARPGEGAVQGAAGGGRGGNAGELAATGGGRGNDPAVTQANAARVFQIIGLPAPNFAGGGRGGGGGGRGGAPGNAFVATTGDYSVVLRIGNTVQKQRLRLENVGAGGSGSPFGPASGDEDADNEGAANARGNARTTTTTTAGSASGTAGSAARTGTPSSQKLKPKSR
ncbi:MAG: WD40/YVTN/BNR-like repeat-containing protein [Gemmatimonas sp.]